MAGGGNKLCTRTREGPYSVATLTILAHGHGHNSNLPFLNSMSNNSMIHQSFYLYSLPIALQFDDSSIILPLFPSYCFVFSFSLFALKGSAQCAPMETIP